MGFRSHKRGIQIASAVMMGMFGIAMLITGILFLKNNIFEASKGNREVIATVNGTKIYRDDFEREVYSLKNQLKEINQQKIQQLSQVGVSADNIKDVPDNIINQIPELKKLLQLRKALVALKGPMGNMPDFRKAVAEAIKDEKSREQLLLEIKDEQDKE